MEKVIDDRHKRILFINDGGDFEEEALLLDEKYDDYDVLYYIYDDVYDRRRFATAIIFGNMFLKNNPRHTLGYVSQTSSINWLLQMDMESSLYSNSQFFIDPSRIKFGILNNISKRDDDSEYYGFIIDFMKLTEAKKVDDKIDMFVRDIKEDKSLSTFDKLMAIQLICTSFINSDATGEVKGQVLQFDYEKGIPNFGTALKILSDSENSYRIKCSGYVDLFARMAYKLGIKASPLLVYNQELGILHAVAQVDVDDDRYGVHGTYICDLRNDSDFREWYEDKKRRKIEEEGIDMPFWSIASIRYFCVDKNDFEKASGLAKSSLPTKYYTGCLEDKREISRGRIDANTYKTSLLRVYEHIYSWVGGKREVTSRIVDDVKEAVELIRVTRNYIDKQTFDDTSDSKVGGVASKK